jgi:hypothetical protein
MKTIVLKCENCGTEFKRLAKEVKRCAKKGFGIACNRSCSTSLRNKKSPYKGECVHLRSYTRQDEFSPFRYYRNKANSKQRSDKYGESDLTLDYLKLLWEAQNGICLYTGYKMDLPINTKQHNKLHTPFSASLDRIDSSKGYIQGNVEFVCLAVNYAKNTFSREDILEFFKINK